jgi:hypothetical protein
MIAEQLRMFIEGWAYMGHSALMQRFILRNGVEFAGSKRPKGVKKLPSKRCFEHATWGCLDKEYEYWEGLAVNPYLPIPVHHAWNVLDGVLIDQTWDKPEDCLYMGIQVSAEDLTEHLSHGKYYGLLDTGFGLNHEFMFARDPELESIVSSVNINKRDFTQLLCETRDSSLSR